MDQYLGMIMLWPSPRIPVGWALCNGSTLPITGNEALYALLGTTYGGDGRTNFGLPDFRGRVPVGVGQQPNASIYTLAQKGGVEAVAINTSQMPNHTHAFTGTVSNLTASVSMYASNGVANSTTPSTGNVLGAPNSETSDGPPYPILSLYTNPGNMVQVSNLVNITLAGSPFTITNTGAGAAHNNLQPYVVLNYYICTQGIYPVNPN